MVRDALPECSVEASEKRFLAELRKATADDQLTVEDAWLQGKYPDSDAVLIVSEKVRPDRRYGYRMEVWRRRIDPVPVQQVWDHDLGLFEWWRTDSARHGHGPDGIS